MLFIGGKQVFSITTKKGKGNNKKKTKKKTNKKQIRRV